MSELRPVPTLDELAADPAKAAELPAQTVEVMLARSIAVQAALYGRLLAIRADGKPAPEEDRLVGVDRAAELLSTTEDWLYRHAKELPFVVRSGRHLRFSSAGIARYIREQQGA